jgi:hypothetical protein
MFPNLDDLVLFGAPLMPLIFGIVEFIKARGVSGTPLTVISAGLGVLGAVVYQLTTVGVPVDFYGWLYLAGFGIFVGLATSGVYKFISVRAPKVRG